MKKGASGNRYHHVSKNADATQLRLGAVQYLNARPMLYGLLQAGLGRETNASDVVLKLAEPSDLHRGLIEEDLDAALAPIASLAYHGGLDLLPGMAIGSDGPVQSVLLVSNRPIESTRVLLLDNASRTSSILARLVLQHRKVDSLGYQSHGEEILKRVRTATNEHIAGLLIGDRALEHLDKFEHVLDLGAAWKEMTGLPFVYAAWLARPGHLSFDHLMMLRASLEAGLIARKEIARTWNRGSERYERYLTEHIRYGLGEREMQGLKVFFERASVNGLLPKAEFARHQNEQVQVLLKPSIRTLLERGARGRRLSFDDLMRLAHEAPFFELGQAADERRKRLHPDAVVTYIVDRNINYTNVCTTSCRFCAFYRPVGHREGYVLSRDVLREKIQETLDAGGIQILLQGGLNPDLPLRWYEDLFRWMKAEFPTVALHALSPEEIWHLSRLEEISIEDVLRRLKDAGMDSLPGGGAEVLTDRVRSQIARAKCTSEEWLECMRVAHRLGMRSTATMMFGTTDTWVDRIAHILKIRDLQDETHGFTAFIAWDYQYEHGVKQRAGETGTIPYLRTQAIARLALDNVPNIQASWVTQGPGVGQIALRFGANDMGSVMFEENVVSSAGTTFDMDANQIERHARIAGFKVARRNMRYELLNKPE